MGSHSALKILCVLLHRLEASAVLWDVHAGKPSTHILTPPKIGALREVARDNIMHGINVWTENRHVFDKQCKKSED